MPDKLVECPNCKGEGFITDLIGAGSPCPVCQGEGEVPEAQATGSPRPPGKPGQC